MKYREPAIGYYIKRISHGFKSRMDENLSKNGITFSQFDALLLIHFNGGKITQKNLELLLNVSHPTVVGLVKRLEQSGFIISYMDQNNKRNKYICTTEMAENRLEQMEISRREIDEIILKDITDEELQQFTNVAKKILINLER